MYCYILIKNIVNVFVLFGGSGKAENKIQVYRWFIFLFKSTAFLLRLNVFLVIFLIDGILRRMLWLIVFFILLCLLYVENLRFYIF